MCFLISVVCFFLMAIDFLVMPLDGYRKVDSSALNLITGIVFWSTLVVGCAAQVMLSRKRKVWCGIYGVNETIDENARVGLLSFFQNGPGKAADIALGVSLVLLVAAMIVTRASGYVCYVFLACFVFSLCMHCVLNGKNYYYLSNKRNIITSLKNKKNGKEKEER